MNEELPSPHPVDRLVADHLRGLAQRVDADRLIARVCRQMPQPLRGETGGASGLLRHSAGDLAPRWQRAAAWLLMATLAVMVAFAGGRWITPSRADAATVLRTVHLVHSRPVDRCYRVQFAPAAEYWDGRNPLTGPSDTLLWTRGDRFWADATLGRVKLVFGRDEEGRLWLSPSRSTGIELTSVDGRLPVEIAMYCAINAMTVPTLVEDVLADFDLRADGPPAGHDLAPEDSSLAAAPHSIVWATLKPGHVHPQISSALLEIDATGTLVRLILWTVEKGRPRGTVTFTLVDTAHGSDEQYRLESHLDAGAEVRVHLFPRQADDAGSPPHQEADGPTTLPGNASPSDHRTGNDQ